ncbi:MAG: DNA polymerase III subunit delta [Chloroflexi bacterium]|nr:DNA polymerase III subunit delta [Chloroflexota bacterium]
MNGAAPVAYWWGEDAFAMDQATHRMAQDLGGGSGPLEIWRVAADDESAVVEGTAATAAGSTPPLAAGRRTARLLDQIEQHVYAAPLFGGGTLAVVRQPVSLFRETAARDRLLSIIGSVPPGNGLALLDLSAGGARRTKSGEQLAEAVAAAGGRVVEFPALTRDRMERWIAARAGELGVGLEPGAVQLLAERVGAYVREGDVDRRRQTELANGELEKLALYRPGGTISRADVGELVSEAVPGSMWAFLDAVGSRRVRQAVELAGRLEAQGSPLPVIVSQLHRRLRDLLIIREALAGGTRASELPRLLKLQPFRAQKLSEQAVTWSLPGLEAALEGLLQLDLDSKGIALDGSTPVVSDDRSALALDVWLVERVAEAER